MNISKKEVNSIKDKMKIDESYKYNSMGLARTCA